MRLLRLRGRKTTLRVQKDGNLWKGRHMLVRWLSGAPRHPSTDPARRGIYIGTLASSRLHKSAVKRNRMRRRCREAWRTALQAYDERLVAKPGLGPIQLLVLPRSSSLRAPFADLQREVRAFLSSIHGVAETQ